ncbi:MAG: thioredoxin [Actinomycetota bacterium]
MSDGILNLSTATFDETVKSSDKPLLVDFWAEWCGPCKMIAPILEELAREQPGIQVAKVDVDTNQELAARFNVMSIPTLLVIQDGEIKKRLVGAKGKSALLADLQEFLTSSL